MPKLILLLPTPTLPRQLQTGISACIACGVSSPQLQVCLQSFNTLHICGSILYLSLTCLVTLVSAQPWQICMTSFS